jgi:hypothetical protein
LQVIEDFLAPSQMTADGVALKFSESVQKLARTERDPQMAAMNEVADMLPDTVLLDYIRAQIPSNDKLWTFRKHLAVQYACLVLVQHALFCAPPTPSKLVFSKLQGDVAIIGAVPGLSKDNSKMTDDFAETGAVPFRMTRMMTILLSSVGEHARVAALPARRHRARRGATRRREGSGTESRAQRACARRQQCVLVPILTTVVGYRPARGLFRSCGCSGHGDDATPAHAQASSLLAAARGASLVRVPAGVLRTAAVCSRSRL